MGQTNKKTRETLVLGVSRASVGKRWRRGGDSNPRYPFGVHSISSAAPSTRLGHLSGKPDFSGETVKADKIDQSTDGRKRIFTPPRQSSSCSDAMHRGATRHCETRWRVAGRRLPMGEQAGHADNCGYICAERHQL
jgi:hypothetical protein